jgi:hypothetical protein
LGHPAGNIAKFWISKKPIVRQLGELILLAVVFHFQTNSNALWLENFLLFVRTISWLHFSHWFKFQAFQVAESNVTEIKAATEKIKRVQIVKLRKGLSCLSNQFFWVVNGLE